MSRKYFINPYTFIPLRSEGAIFPPRDQVTHAWFEPGTFTGRITCQLTFLTPVIIPGEQRAGTEEEPGYICTYLHQGRLAIPGSRLRGYLLNLMRTINSSPLVHFQDQEILKRRKNNPRKGFIIKKDNGQWAIQEVDNEVLIMHNNRNRVNQKLSGGCEPEFKPQSFTFTGTPCDIPSYNTVNAKTIKPTKIYFQQATWKPSPQYKKYLAQKDIGSPQPLDGRWVKFEAWSGQDGANCLPDNEGNSGTHWNQWHLVNLDECGKDYELDKDFINDYKVGVEAMARRLKENKTHAGLAAEVLKMKKLTPGMFVYFLLGADNRTVVSMGRHYHYLVRLGTVGDKVRKACGLAAGTHTAPCLVQQLAGWASGREGGLKSRLWVEMALVSREKHVEICEKNLRILSSQPPQAHNFYLRGGDYDHENSRIRGRKFYWHDPRWGDKMWDNQDLGEGDCAFENPQPGLQKLWEQWSKAQVIWATREQPVTFEFDLRVLNLTQDELYLLITALVGFDPKILDGGILGQGELEDWCHKIGHARPFLGSSYIRITKAEALRFDKNTWKPRICPISLSEWLPRWQTLKDWQNSNLEKENHIACLKRVMRFRGAYEDLKEDEKEARISYPLGQKKVYSLTWEIPDDTKQPKIFHWFSQKVPPSLPDPKPGYSQALQVVIEPPKSQ
ncbi:MAG: TIGR03986 family CRISPR-associated RAMP protein [Thermodesulfobacteriota bacterium]